MVTRRSSSSSFGLSVYLSHWIGTVASKTSLHGIPWYANVKFLPFRAVILCFGLLVLVGGPLFIVYEANLFFGVGAATKTVTELRSAAGRVVDFPTLTVCNPLFFARDAMQST